MNLFVFFKKQRLLTAALILLFGAAVTGVLFFFSDPSGKGNKPLPLTLTADTVEKEDCMITAVGTKTFYPVSIEDALIELKQLEYEYTGSEIRPGKDNGGGLLTVSVNGVVLMKNVDYTVFFSDNVNAGRSSARLIVTGIGDYTGEKSITFSIVPAPTSALPGSNENGGLLLSWSEVPGADGYQLECSLDDTFDPSRCFYEECEGLSFDFTDSIEPGESVYVRIRAFILSEKASSADDPELLRVYGEYCDPARVYAKNAIHSMSLSGSSFVYAGKDVCPGVTAYSGKGEKLILDADFTVSYLNNTAPGVATAVVSGTGDYSGELSADFVIKPSKNILALTSVSGGKITVSWNADPDCDGYIILYSSDPGFSRYDYFTTYDSARTSATIDTGSKSEETWYLKLSAFVVTNRERGSWKGVYSDVIIAVTNPAGNAASASPGSSPPAPTAPSTQDSPGSTAPYVDLKELRVILTKQISDYTGKWSVFVKNLRTGEELVINNRKCFPASLMKLFIMAAAYQEVEDGKLNEEPLIKNITEMITVSSNSASNLLLGQIGYKTPKVWIERNGYPDTYFCRGFLSGVNYKNTVIASGDNYSTVTDIGRLMASIYNGTCVSKAASAKMLNLLKNQVRVSKIPAGVPDGVETANKTGEVSKNTHDCAIVFLDGNPYVLCVMSEFSDSAQKWDGKVTEISETVFDYMKNLV